MSITEIKSREEIEVLVHRFYDKIRDDALLGPVFNSHIPDEDWPAHLVKLTDFWETNLMGVRKFKGSPSQKHIEVDKNLNYKTNQVHFGKWLQLWFETIDELYVGDLADKAKRAARKMATGQFLVMWRNRPEQKKTMIAKK